MRSQKLKVSFTAISLAALLAISLATFVARAEEILESDTATPTEVSQAAREERQGTQEENQAEYQATIEFAETNEAGAIDAREQLQEPRGVLDARAQERITNLAANIANRLDAVITRFEQIIERLRSRMEKLKATGLDTADVEGHLGQANAFIADAKIMLADIDNTVSQVVGSETPQEAWQTTKGTYQEVRQALLNAHEELRQAVSHLKEAAAPVEPSN